ncbi:hypothetical protein WJX84_001538 [Apatococcus fuscideae]|uniref:Cytidyltransferase-like domain-containing protein n=1 Tax=Apatococcus fuscideae TaxID=2026836 RepID=A0AAW1TNI9_9CHLO
MSRLAELSLTQLARCYDVAARYNPRLDLIPLLPSAGWSISKVAALEDLRTFLQEGSTQLYEAICAARPSALEPVTIQEVAQPDSDDVPSESNAAVTAQSDAPLRRYQHVAVGGTFDRLHAGHRILLAAAALSSLSNLYIGITSDKLLQRKQHHDLLESFDHRQDAALAFMKAVNPRIAIRSGALTDPEEPTQAATDPSMQALVVSQETIQGGHSINTYRTQHGSKPLELIVIELVGIHAATPSGKLSSTELRAMEAQKRGPA